MPNTPINQFFAVVNADFVIQPQETFEIRRPTFDGVTCDYGTPEIIVMNTADPVYTHPSIAASGFSSNMGFNNMRNISLVCFKNFESTLNPDQTSTI